MIQLINDKGLLCIPADKDEDDPDLILYRYSSGDCDTVNWPNPNIKLLRGALFDAREMGVIADIPSVLLPDGTQFDIDEPYFQEGDRVVWTDPSDTRKKQEGFLTWVEYVGDFRLNIQLDKEWQAEVCESELRKL